MPITPKAARKASNHRRSPEQASGRRDGEAKRSTFCEPASVQDRIRQWQAQGAADALPPDAVSVRSLPRSETPQTPKISRPSSPDERPPRTTPAKEGTKWIRKDNQEWSREGKGVKTASRRKPSDGDQPSPSSSNINQHKSPRVEKTPERQLLDEERRARNISSSRAERDERRQRRRDMRSRTKNTIQDSSDGIRVYPKSPSQPQSEPHQDLGDSVIESNMGDGLTSRLLSPEPELIFSDPEGLQLEEDRKNTKPSKYAETLGRAPQYAEDIDQLKSRKRDLLNKTKGMLTGKNDFALPISNRLPSIEAWLEEQPDPFIDVQDHDDEPSIDIPKSLKKRSGRRKVSSQQTLPEDANKIWESVSRKDRSSHTKTSGGRLANITPNRAGQERNHGHRQFSFEVADEDDLQHDSKSPSGDTEQNHETPISMRRKNRASRRNARNPSEQAHTTPLAELAQPVSRDANQPHSPTMRKQKPLPQPPSDLPPEYTAQEVGQVKVAEKSLNASPGLKRRLTKHEDLMSVLSQPRTKKSVRSMRSMRRKSEDSSKNVVEETLQAMRQDEEKYNRELRTLVDGVTPVLLQSLLSKTDSAAAAGLFSDNSQNDSTFTKPIIEMGVALERLKSLHNRIPLHSVDSLLYWAQSAHKSYADYIGAWRLGFQGVVVNLAPLDPTQTNEENEGMARDIDGDVIDGDGKKVDVAYLQKRPLVRVKKIARDLSIIQQKLSDNALAAKVAHDFAELTEFAKRRHKEEQGRLEDEVAATIDTTRARDMKTLAPTVHVAVDQTRRVRARDCFSMTLHHSTGQRMDCRIEMVLRDNHSTRTPGGDVLICQVEDDCKWLLFPPVELSKISSRKGEWGDDLVIMIRGSAGISQAWSELLVLVAEDHEAASEWLNMLGSNPLPPKLDRLPSFLERRAQESLASEKTSVAEVNEARGVSLNESALANIPSDIDVPIGEPSLNGSRGQQRAMKGKKGLFEKSTPKLNLGGGLQKKSLPEHYSFQNSSMTNKTNASSIHSSDKSIISDASSMKPLPKLAPTSELSKSSVSSKAEFSPERPPHHQSYSPQKSFVSHSSNETLTARTHEATKSQQNPPSTPPSRSRRLGEGKEDKIEPVVVAQQQDQVSVQRPEFHRTLSSTPSGDLPTIPKIRSPVKDSPPISTPLTESIRDQWAALSGFGKKSKNVKKSPGKEAPFTEDIPQLPAQTKRTSLPAVISSVVDEPPPPPPHRVSMPVRPKAIPIPTTQSPPSPVHGRDGKRLSSSPLKHEYAPSTSDSESESDSDVFSDTSSDTSEDIGSELKDQAMPLVSIGAGLRRYSKTAPKTSFIEASTGTRTLQPSDSASQGPYRKAPPPSAYPADKKKRTIAMVCCWSDKGIWEPLVDDECSIVVSPGLIQAFRMSAAHSQPMSGPEWQSIGNTHRGREDTPLVEFELTPVVPLRKGTALDITIRSPPTANSELQTTNNIMFRSRTVLECDQLYNMINWARCNNPTYQALLRSRPQEEPVTFASNVPNQRTKSWFSFGSREKTSYRASSRPPPSSMGDSDASATSMSSAFSALKRFKKNSPFSLNRSSVVRKSGLKWTGGSLYSSSTGTGTGSGSSTPAPSQAGIIPGPNGPSVPATSAEAANGGGMVNNMKIRFFVRRGQNWEALGPADLTVLPASTSKDDGPAISLDSTPPGSAAPSRRTSAVGQPQQRQFRLPSSSNTPHRIHGDGREKRILITKHRKPDAILLDELLGESCFEKVMQTGVAVNVWKEDDEMQHYGGVMTGRSYTYMIQFRTSAEATWVFNMCGTYRYGNVTTGA